MSALAAGLKEDLIPCAGPGPAGYLSRLQRGLSVPSWMAQAHQHRELLKGIFLYPIVKNRKNTIDLHATVLVFPAPYPFEKVSTTLYPEAHHLLTCLPSNHAFSTSLTA